MDRLLGLYSVLRVISAVVVAVYPFLYGNKLTKPDWRYIVPFVFSASVLGVVEILYDRQKDKIAKRAIQIATDELNVEKQRLDHQKEYGLSMARLMKFMIPASIRLDKLQLMVEELRDQAGERTQEINDIVRQGSTLTDQVISQLLMAVAEEVRAYWKAEADSVKSNLMLAHRVFGSSCSSELYARLEKIAQFIGYGRKLNSYQHALELVLWGVADPEVPPIVLPVEDPSQDEGHKQLIPGAPKSFALRIDTVVPKTKEILTLARPGLDTGVQVQLRNYFEGKRLRSFASLVLREGTRPVGILNIQSDSENVFGVSSSEMDTIIKSIEHYRYCLEQLISSRRKLERAAP